ncbi:MAG: recombinase family protein [Hyphomicrobium sp.]|nr:recombinase family protein [Hyphomicrobium sp.]
MAAEKVIGYARTSTVEQAAGFEAQVRELEAVGATKIFKEQVSSVSHRAQLDALIDFVREGDTVIVTKLDRLARSMRDLLEIVAQIEKKGAGLRILAMNLDTTTATGKLMLNVLGSVAEFERSMMLERQAVGIAKAKAEGKYRGRQPTARRQAGQVEALLEQGLGPVDIARKLGIARSSVYRIAEKAIHERKAKKQLLIEEI